MNKWIKRHNRDEYKLDVGYFKISIHRHIHYEKDDWLVSCGYTPFIGCLLKSKDTEEAMEEARLLVLEFLKSGVKGLSDLTEGSK